MDQEEERNRLDQNFNPHGQVVKPGAKLGK